MCGCDEDSAVDCHLAGEGQVCTCKCHADRETAKATPAAATASAPVVVHRVDVKAYDASGVLVYALEAVDPGSPGYLRFNITHTEPEPGAHLTALSIGILERDPL